MRLITHSLITALLVIIAATLQAQPVANFTATPLTGCAPMLVTFTNTSTGNPTSFQWTLGNSATSVLPNPTTTYTIPGTYTVTLTVSNASGTDVETKTNYITVLANPIVNFTVNDTASCPPLNAIFTNTSNPVTPGPATYNWSFGDGYLSPFVGNIPLFTSAPLCSSANPLKHSHYPCQTALIGQHPFSLGIVNSGNTLIIGS